MRKLFLKFSPYFFPFILILLTLFLALRNNVVQTTLSGWDSLHPEFNFGLYLKRIFWGVWQEHQGLGAVASQAHAAELTRLPIVYLLSLILPLNLVRFSFFFLTLAAGSLGTYWLARYFLSREANRFVSVSSFIAAVFYLLNLATVQQYYVPLEMFAVFFAALPWLIYSVASYIREGTKKKLFGLAIITLFSSSMAHTPTLFYIYLAGLILFLLTLILLNRRKDSFKRGVIVVLLTLGLNLYWLVPNLYYIAGHASEVQNSKISQVFSDEAFLQSRAFGNVSDLGLLKNFLFNWREYSFEKGKFVDLMNEWTGHLAKPGVGAIGYITICFAAFGIIVALFRKNKYAISLLPVLLMAVFFWINENPPLTSLFASLRESFPILGEALRFPFTKFSILLISALSVYLAFSVNFLLSLIKRRFVAGLFCLVILGANIYLCLPAFSGNLISPSMKVKIPDEYFQAFDWFKNQDPNIRIAKLPLNTFWGWNYYSWGYQGAGFTWFGIPQPTLDREFDRWGVYNEDFYRQASNALYEQDSALFEKTLEKYRVGYLWLDESIINAGGTDRVLMYPQIKNLLSASKYIKQVAKFDFITIYSLTRSNLVSEIWAPQTVSKINADMMYSDIDRLFNRLGHYYFDASGAVFPFTNLEARGPVTVKEDNGKLTLVNRENEYKLSIPANLLLSEDLYTQRGFSEPTNCDLEKIGTVRRSISQEGITYKATGGGVSCDFFAYLNLAYSEGYLLHIKGENITGRSLKIYLNDLATSKMDMEEVLPKGKFDSYFVIEPKKQKGSGYVLNVETRSYGNIASENRLEQIEIYKLPVDWIINISFDLDSNINFANKVEIAGSDRILSWLYKAKVKGTGIIALNQSYEKGWIALASRPNLQILKHIKVDGWANGWEIAGQDKIIIFFWPQLLETAGLIFALIVIVTRLPVDKRGE